jgi:hypothetical protein
MSLSYFRVPLGRVADFCPICRRFEAARLIDVRLARGLEHRSGGGRSVEHVRVCEVCETEVPASEDDYAATDAPPDMGVEDLLRHSQPDAAGRWAERLALENRLRAGAASAEDRRTLIAEPFFALDRILRIRGCTGEIGALARGVFGVLTLLTFFGVMRWVPEGDLVWAGPVVALVLAGIAAGAVVTQRRAPRAYVRKHLEPNLVKALTPIRPRPDELASVYAELKGDRVLLTRYVDAPALAGVTSGTRMPKAAA